MREKVGEVAQDRLTRTQTAMLRSLIVNRPERRRNDGVLAELANEFGIGRTDPYDAGTLVFRETDFAKATELLRGRSHSATGVKSNAAILANTLSGGVEPVKFNTQVLKSGPNLAVELPASVVHSLELHEGDKVEILVARAADNIGKRWP